MPSIRAVVCSTLFGGTNAETVSAVAVDADGSVHFAGTTGSADLPLRQPIQATCDSARQINGCSAYIAKLNPADQRNRVESGRASRVPGQPALFEPTLPSTLYALACGNVRKSLDAARSWKETTLGRMAASIALDPSLPDDVYAAASTVGIYRSRDRAETWSLVSDAFDHDFRSILGGTDAFLTQIALRE